MSFDSLYDSIQKRPRPEDVAELILEVNSGLTVEERKELDTAAKHSLKRMAYAYSSMAADFVQVRGADRLVARAATNFGLEPLSARDCLDVTRVREFAETIGASISMCLAQRDFKSDRLNREQRKKAGIEIRKRGYNRRVRTLRRLGTRLEAMTRNGEKYLASRVAKSSGATFVTLEELSKDLDTACFIAYLSARMNTRSVFTDKSQERAFDTISNMLYQRAIKGTPNWYAIAMVHPEPEVLANLEAEEKIHLMGVWTECLARLAALLKTLFQENQFNLQTMIVRRGNDSSSWNAAAGAWNKARAQWISLTYALGMESLLETYCPGKVMRLMAADVARWHSMSKGADSLDPNTKVWYALPMPWLVFNETAECPKALVKATCELFGVALDGWVSPPPKKRPVAFKATPELVHGVAVSSPHLASLIRKAGWFSGKPSKGDLIQEPVVTHHDEHGFVTGVGVD